MEDILGRNEVMTQLESIRDEIIHHYTQYYSVSHILRDFGFKGSYRGPIEDILKSEGIYQGVGGKTAQARVKKIESSMMSKYGVKNYGQLHHGGYSGLNSIERTIPNFIEKYKKYVEDSKIIVHVNRKKLIIPKFCYYTGIMFVDEELERVNPNDYRKRSLDHKISLWYGFMNGISLDNINDVGNLIYCLKYCNTMKGIMNHVEFRKYAIEIREKFINEGYKHN
jgi:hypothetical protein